MPSQEQDAQQDARQLLLSAWPGVVADKPEEISTTQQVSPVPLVRGPLCARRGADLLKAQLCLLSNTERGVRSPLEDSSRRLGLAFNSPEVSW